jgi:ketosteroid isomerase-like protein
MRISLKTTAGPLLLIASLSIAAMPANLEEESPPAVAMRLFAAFNRHDLEAMARLYDEQSELRSPDFCAPRRGPEGVRKTYSELFRAFPDITDEIVVTVASGHRVALQFVARSNGLKPRHELKLATFLTVRRGLILRDETYFDTQGQPCR